jgi:ABC-type uncharacterized transport system permease subunit
MSTVLGLVVAVAYAFSALIASRRRALAVHGTLVVAWALHGVLLLASLVGFGEEGLRFGFAPALSFTAWLVVTVYGIESRLQPKLQAYWALSELGAVAVVLTLLFPGSLLHVRASIWLPLHLALGIASYGLFAVAVIHAGMMTRAERQIRLAVEDQGGHSAGIPLLTLERLTFRFVMAGFILLSATLLAGWFFGETLYGPGKAWKWDHKTIFSVLAWLTFALLLTGRARFGWRGRKAVRVLYIGASLLLLAYTGSRFVLEVILGRTT